MVPLNDADGAWVFYGCRIQFHIACGHISPHLVQYILGTLINGEMAGGPIYVNIRTCSMARQIDAVLCFLKLWQM